MTPPLNLDHADKWLVLKTWHSLAQAHVIFISYILMDGTQPSIMYSAAANLLCVGGAMGVMHQLPCRSTVALHVMQELCQWLVGPGINTTAW